MEGTNNYISFKMPSISIAIRIVLQEVILGKPDEHSRPAHAYKQIHIRFTAGIADRLVVTFAMEED